MDPGLHQIDRCCCVKFVGLRGIRCYTGRKKSMIMIRERVKCKGNGDTETETQRMYMSIWRLSETRLGKLRRLKQDWVQSMHHGDILFRKSGPKYCTSKC